MVVFIIASNDDLSVYSRGLINEEIKDTKFPFFNGVDYIRIHSIKTCFD